MMAVQVSVSRSVSFLLRESVDKVWLLCISFQEGNTLLKEHLVPSITLPSEETKRLDMIITIH